MDGRQQTCEDDILKMNEPILMAVGTHWPLGSGHVTDKFGGQKVKGQGHMRPKWVKLVSMIFQNQMN